MERPIEINDFVTVSFDHSSQTYIIKDIQSDGIHISPISNIDQKFLLVETSGKWQLSGISEPHKVEFSNRESLPQLLFTEIPDIDLEILKDVNDDILYSVCQTSRYAKELCDKIWTRRINQKMPEAPKTSGQIYRYFANPIVYVLSKKDTGAIGVFRKYQDAVNALMTQLIVAASDRASSEDRIDDFMSEGWFDYDLLLSYVYDKTYTEMVEEIEENGLYHDYSISETTIHYGF